MSSNNIYYKINNILKSYAGNKEINLQTSLSDNGLNLDSLQMVSLMVDIEDAFNIEFPDEMMGLTSLTDCESLVNIVTQLLKSKNNQ